MSQDQLRTVVFDMDDTLYLERDYVRSGFEAVGAWLASEAGIEGFAARAWAAFEGGARGTIFDDTLEALGAPAGRTLIAELVRVYREHEPDIELLPDARACLESLHGRVAIAVVTDGPRASQRAKARALELERWADPIVFTDELGPGFGKPHPRAFEIVEARTAARGDACIYLADNPAKDFQGPRALGWRVLRISRPGGLHHTRTDGTVPMMNDLRSWSALLEPLTHDRS